MMIPKTNLNNSPAKIDPSSSLASNINSASVGIHPMYNDLMLRLKEGNALDSGLINDIKNALQGNSIAPSAPTNQTIGQRLRRNPSVTSLGIPALSDPLVQDNSPQVNRMSAPPSKEFTWSSPGTYKDATGKMYRPRGGVIPSLKRGK